MKVINEIQIYERNGQDTEEKILISSHWNEKAKIVIEFEGKRITVLASDVERACSNATNWKGY